MRKTDSARRYPSTPQPPPFTSAPQVQSIYRIWIYFHIRFFFHSQSITLNDYDNFSHPLFLFFFAQNMPGLLFVRSGLLQIKEQTNRSSAGAFTTLQLFFFCRLGILPSAKGHQLPRLCCTSARPGQKTALTLVIVLHAYFCLRGGWSRWTKTRKLASRSCKEKKKTTQHPRTSCWGQVFPHVTTVKTLLPKFPTHWYRSWREKWIFLYLFFLLISFALFLFSLSLSLAFSLSVYTVSLCFLTRSEFTLLCYELIRWAECDCSPTAMEVYNSVSTGLCVSIQLGS